MTKLPRSKKQTVHGIDFPDFWIWTYENSFKVIAKYTVYSLYSRKLPKTHLFYYAGSFRQFLVPKPIHLHIYTRSVWGVCVCVLNRVVFNGLFSTQCFFFFPLYLDSFGICRKQPFKNTPVKNNPIKNSYDKNKPVKKTYLHRRTYLCVQNV